MQIILKGTSQQLTDGVAEEVQEKLAPTARLLGDDAETALLELEIEDAPAEGRSSEPVQLIGNLRVAGKVYHAEVVKPTPLIAADRLRGDLEQEIRHDRGRARALWRRGSGAVKDILRFGR